MTTCCCWRWRRLAHDVGRHGLHTTLGAACVRVLRRAHCLVCSVARLLALAGVFFAFFQHMHALPRAAGSIYLDNGACWLLPCRRGCVFADADLLCYAAAAAAACSCVCVCVVTRCQRPCAHSFVRAACETARARSFHQSTGERQCAWSGMLCSSYHRRGIACVPWLFWCFVLLSQVLVTAVGVWDALSSGSLDVAHTHGLACMDAAQLPSPRCKSAWPRVPCRRGEVWALRRIARRCAVSSQAARHSL